MGTEGGRENGKHHHSDPVHLSGDHGGLLPWPDGEGETVRKATGGSDPGGAGFLSQRGDHRGRDGDLQPDHGDGLFPGRDPGRAAKRAEPRDLSSDIADAGAGGRVDLVRREQDPVLESESAAEQPGEVNAW